MKRPGDEPSPTLQPASKLQKSVTFSFPIQSTQLQAKETISTPYPSSLSTSLPSASPVMQTGNTHSQLQPSQPPQGRLMTEGGGSNNKPSILRSGAQQTNITSNSSQQQQQLNVIAIFNVTMIEIMVHSSFSSASLLLNYGVLYLMMRYGKHG